MEAIFDKQQGEVLNHITKPLRIWKLRGMFIGTLFTLRCILTLKQLHF